MNYIKITENDIANGTGIRVVLWVSGCDIHCDNCHNPETWDFNAGEPFDDTAKKKIFGALNKPYIQGITFSGGHPLDPRNVQLIHELICEVKDKFPDKDIWLYTGYELNIENFTILYKGIDPESIHHNLVNYIIRLCDVVVDGVYIDKQRDLTLAFRGSKNQRIIDVKETLRQNRIIEMELDK